MVEKTKPVVTRAKKSTVTAKVEPVEKVEPIIPEVKPAKEEKPKKQKLVRDSFTMPQDEYAHIAALKARCLKAGVSAKKSELLRAALVNLAGLSDKALLGAVASLKQIKTGRPAKG
jgi:hypothetical protein